MFHGDNYRINIPKSASNLAPFDQGSPTIEGRVQNRHARTQICHSNNFMKSIALKIASSDTGLAHNVHNCSSGEFVEFSIKNKNNLIHESNNKGRKYLGDRMTVMKKSVSSKSTAIDIEEFETGSPSFGVCLSE